MIDEPNGLARRRRITLARSLAKSQTRTADAISFVLSNTALEYLVHRHLRLPGKGRKPRALSFPEFLRILRERYGFFGDQSRQTCQCQPSYCNETGGIWNDDCAI